MRHATEENFSSALLPDEFATLCHLPMLVQLCHALPLADANQVAGVLQTLCQTWRGADYDLLAHNCCSFGLCLLRTELLWRRMFLCAPCRLLRATSQAVWF